MKKSGCLGAGVLLALLARTATAWEIQLTAEELWGVAGPRRIACGVPLLAGQARDVGELRLLARQADGRTVAVPAQFRELARWWRGDNSLRWVLVDLQSAIKARESLAFVLTNEGKAATPVTPLSLRQEGDLIVVTTGPARFAVNSKRFNFLARAVVDVNGDGKLTDDENLLVDDAGCGTVMEDTFGQRYLGSAGTESVEVLESGPLRVCIRARGRHPAPPQGGYTPGLYGYDVFLNFYAGSSDVYADVIVCNNFARSIGIPALEEGALVLKLAGGAAQCRLWGGGPLERKLAAGESLCLYQDSNGADTWAHCPGFGKMETSGWKRLPEQLTTFRGFKILKRAGGQEEELAAGDHARGLLQAWNERGGVVVHTKNFWQQFPKAAEVGADGSVRLGLWPREFKYPHLIQDGAAKGYEVVLHFSGAKATGGEYSRDAAGQPSAEEIANCWDARVMLRPTAEHRGATGALSDLGPYTPPTRGLDKKPDTRTAIDAPRMLSDDKLYGNAYGWRVFGERWRSNGGHGSLGARQPIDEDNYLFRYYLTGLVEWLAAGDARSRHFRDVRRYRIDGVDALGFKDWAEFRAANISERDEWTRRPQPDSEESARYRQGLPGYSSGWAFPNPEHHTLDLLYDRYLLCGDVRSLENMRVAAGHGAFFAIGYAPKPGADLAAINRTISRDRGWAWRTLERYWELTGDKRADELLRKTIAAYEPLIGKTNLWFPATAYQREWFTRVFSRAAAMTALHTGDPKALEICRALASDKEKNPGDFSTLLAVLYHLTGEQKYKDWMAGQLQDDKLLSVGGYFPISDHWFLTQPPRSARRALAAQP